MFSYENSKQSVLLNRMTAIMLLVRLENLDIPYTLSGHCREQLIYYLSYILTDETRTEQILKIDYEELCRFVDEAESAIKIIKLYRVLT